MLLSPVAAGAYPHRILPDIFFIPGQVYIRDIGINQVATPKSKRNLPASIPITIIITLITCEIRISGKPYS